MKEILQKYPATKEEKKWNIPASYSPDFVMDLHGYTQAEAEKKLEWLLQKAEREPWKKIRIITGKGSGVLFALVQRTTQSGLWGKWEIKILENDAGVEMVISHISYLTN